MKKWNRILVVLFVLFLSASFISCNQPVKNTNPSQKTLAEEIVSYGKPVLVDFGSTSCVPCKMMVPVLEELKEKYASSLETIFINVTEEQAKTKEFAIKTIPTQIFFDATGKEVDRHIGFISTEDILKTFELKGIVINK